MEKIEAISLTYFLDQSEEWQVSWKYKYTNRGMQIHKQRDTNTQIEGYKYTNRMIQKHKLIGYKYKYVDYNYNHPKIPKQVKRNN